MLEKRLPLKFEVSALIARGTNGASAVFPLAQNTHLDGVLAHTIVPWIAEWLSYYELWHATGEWLGGGTEPVEKKTIRKDKEKTYERE